MTCGSVGSVCVRCSWEMDERTRCVDGRLRGQQVFAEVPSKGSHFRVWTSVSRWRRWGKAGDESLYPRIHPDILSISQAKHKSTGTVPRPASRSRGFSSPIPCYGPEPWASSVGRSPGHPPRDSQPELWAGPGANNKQARMRSSVVSMDACGSTEPRLLHTSYECSGSASPSDQKWKEVTRLYEYGVVSPVARRSLCGYLRIIPTPPSYYI